MIEIIKPGFYTLIQDIGRNEYQEYGMPVAGVMDRDSYRLANYLVENTFGEAVLEITMTGPEILFLEETEIGITGADMSPMINGAPIEMYTTILVSKGDVLSFGKLKNGFRSYLSINGGFEVDKKMNSRSTYAYAGVGGFYGRALEIGDAIPVGVRGSVQLKKVPELLFIKPFSTTSIRVIQGPEFEVLKLGEDSCFFSTEYCIENNSNRMGFRLKGRSIAHDAKEMLSTGIVNGTIQLPPEGMPIVLLADAQTTGGYPRIANVIQSDLPLLAQLKPGDKLRFRKVTIEEGQSNYYNKEKQFNELLGISKK